MISLFVLLYVLRRVFVYDDLPECFNAPGFIGVIILTGKAVIETRFIKAA